MRASVYCRISTKAHHAHGKSRGHTNEHLLYHQQSRPAGAATP
jgi:hypothetical protein